MFDYFSPVLVRYTAAVGKALQRKQELMSHLTTRVPITPPPQRDPYKVDTTMDAAITTPFFSYPSTYL